MVKKFKINYINLGGSNYVDAKDPTKENIVVGKKGVKAKVINKYFLGASWAYQLELGEKLPLLNITNCKIELKKNQYIRVNASKKDIFIFQE